MFGFVTANREELSQESIRRYSSVYCGICRNIRQYASQVARLGLSYDMAFLALLLMSLYEPEESSGSRACALHPLHPRPWVDNEYVRYSAQMNIALTYYKALDDYRDEKKPGAKILAKALKKYIPEISQAYPRQCNAIENCIETLSRLEKENCQNPDEPANCFGTLMAELFVYHEDLWQDDLMLMGKMMGRFIYLADAAIDYKKDQIKHNYNPFLAAGMADDPALWEDILTMAMARCTQAFERLPLVQDKEILDNILYSGIWAQYHTMQRKLHPGGTSNE